MTVSEQIGYKPQIGGGIYTVPDAACILNLPLPKVKRWVSGYSRLAESGGRVHLGGIVDDGVWGAGREQGLNFHALIEVFTFSVLRDLGVSSQAIRSAREELIERFQTPYPFASHRLLSDGRQIHVVLDRLDSLMALDEQGQTELRKIVEPFCHKIDFCDATSLAERYWPLGRDRAVVVDPHHGFGRPCIANTNIATETLANMVRAGETAAIIAAEFEIRETDVLAAVEFESKKAA